MCSCMHVCLYMLVFTEDLISAVATFSVNILTVVLN